MLPHGIDIDIVVYWKVLLLLEDVGSRLQIPLQPLYDGQPQRLRDMSAKRASGVSFN